MYTAPRIATTCIRSESDAATRIEIALPSALTRTERHRRSELSPDRGDLPCNMERILAPTFSAHDCRDGRIGRGFAGDLAPARNRAFSGNVPPVLYFEMRRCWRSYICLISDATSPPRRHQRREGALRLPRCRSRLACHPNWQEDSTGDHGSPMCRKVGLPSHCNSASALRDSRRPYPSGRKSTEHLAGSPRSFLRPLQRPFWRRLPSSPLPAVGRCLRGGFSLRRSDQIGAA